MGVCVCVYLPASSVSVWAIVCQCVCVCVSARTRVCTRVVRRFLLRLLPLRPQSSGCRLTWNRPIAALNYGPGFSTSSYLPSVTRFPFLHSLQILSRFSPDSLQILSRFSPDSSVMLSDASAIFPLIGSSRVLNEILSLFSSFPHTPPGFFRFSRDVRDVSRDSRDRSGFLACCRHIPSQPWKFFDFVPTLVDSLGFLQESLRIFKNL